MCSFRSVRHFHSHTVLLAVALVAISSPAYGRQAATASQPAPSATASPNTSPRAEALPPAAGPAVAKWFENLSLFVGPDGSKQPQDLGINANMGMRFSANTGIALSDRHRIGAQIGAAVNLSDAAVHVLDQVEGTSRRTQTFLTAGVFQRALGRWNWGVAYDQLWQTYYDDFRLGQWRGQLGYALRASDEVGAWFTKSAYGDDGRMAGTAVRLDPISQINGYTRHTWSNAAQTTVWVGMAAGHHNVVWVFPDNSRDEHVLVYGAELYMPLSERFAITGAANLVTPTATGTVDAYLGVSFFPGRGAIRASRNTFAPFTGVANNPTFSVDLKR